MPIPIEKDRHLERAIAAITILKKAPAISSVPVGTSFFGCARAVLAATCTAVLLISVVFVGLLTLFGSEVLTVFE